MEPKHAPIQVSAINDDRIPAWIFRTYARLVRLTWTHNWEFTDWLDMPALLDALGGIDRATFFRHASRLKELGLLDWSTDGKNRMRFFILEVRLGKVALSHPCDPSSGSGINSSLTDKELPLEPAKSHPCDKPLMLDVLDHESWQALREARIGEPARTRLANLPNCTPHYVRAMAAQARADGLGTGGLIFRIENDWPAPSYCEQCGGLEGEHVLGCPTQPTAAPEPVEQEQPPAAPELSGDEALKLGLAIQCADGHVLSIHRIWEIVEGELQLQLTSATFNTWLARSVPIIVNDSTLVIGLHNEHAREWIENRLHGMIQRTLTGVVGFDLQVRFDVQEQPVRGEQ